MKKGKIFTFYSYKGGVGRSMAMANVATLLALDGNKVLVVDWDLEAPGLEQFFKKKKKSGVSLDGDERSLIGVTDLLNAKSDGEELDWREGIINIKLAEGENIHLLSAGKRDKGYQSRVQDLDWAKLFDSHNLGSYIDSLRNQWKEEYNFVFIDSRTGITDIGDICTVILPDVLVPIFVTNDQNINGTKSILQRAQHAHKKLTIDRSYLVAVPILGRDEVYNEYDDSQRWKGIVAESLEEYYQDWIPKDASVEEVLNKLFVPYVAKWSFGDRLPVVENPHEISNPSSISAAYDRIATLFQNDLDWTALEAKVDPQALKDSKARIRELESAIDQKKSKSNWRSVATGVAMIFIIGWVVAAFGPQIVSNFFSNNGDIKEAYNIIQQNAGRLDAGRSEALELLVSNKEILMGVDVQEAILKDSLQLQNGKMQMLLAQNSNMRHANFSHADLKGASFEDTNLTGAKFDSADLLGASFMGANLRRTSFAGVNLYGVRLDSANLQGADFSSATNYDINKLTKANGWTDAIYSQNILNLIQNAFPDRFGELASSLTIKGEDSGENQSTIWGYLGNYNNLRESWVDQTSFIGFITTLGVPGGMYPKEIEGGRFLLQHRLNFRENPFDENDTTSHKVIATYDSGTMVTIKEVMQIPRTTLSKTDRVWFAISPVDN